jgi:hypothetical protein
MSNNWTLPELQEELEETLSPQYDVLRDDESLCIRLGDDPLVYLQLETTEEGRQEAILNFALDCSPAIAAYLAVIVDSKVFAVIDTEYLFTVTRVDSREFH